jgi:hypothetical protein
MTTRIVAGVFALLFALLFAGAALAEDPAVLRIRKEYQSILSALPRLKAESFELTGYSTEGGEAKAFRDRNGDIRLIKVELFFESGKVLEEFYYEKGALIFAFYQSHRYNAPFYVTPETAKEIGGVSFDPKKTTVTEDRYYFDKGSMIRWLNEDKVAVKPENKDFKDAEKEILETSNEMLSKFKRKTELSVQTTSTRKQ